MPIKNITCIIAISLSISASAQINLFDSTIKTRILKEVSVTAFKTVKGTGHMPDFKNGIIYAGKKNEVIIVDSLDANKAINNTRQILGRIPGLNIAETESSGFTANGIATRGLNPIQSIEMNTRQNGYNISGDIFGYNEAYYIPPMEAVQRIEMIRGAASLQFGPQFGGLVNYVVGELPSTKPFEFTTSQTIGSFGMFNTFNAISGTYKNVNYYAFLQYRNMEGYRPNSQQWQASGFGKIQYSISKKLNAGIEYSILRNKIQMPGGLTDSLFYANPTTSTRARNWLITPWNIVTAFLNYSPSENTSISLKTTYLFSNRSLVWRNEDGGPSALDNIDPLTNNYVPREVGIGNMNSIANELRISKNYTIGNSHATIATGIRVSHAWLIRKGGGEGTTGSDFDLSITGNWGYNLRFTTTNVAPFAENIFRIGKKLTITPGLRFEYINSTVNGYKNFDTSKQSSNNVQTRMIPLLGLGIELKASHNTNLYVNVSQSYRPIDYSQLEPFGIAAKIDPNLKDASGLNSDIGYRGTIKNFLNFDIGLFYMLYNNRIGEKVETDAQTGIAYAYRTNTGNSVHKGIESYIEFNILKYLNEKSNYGLSIFNSFAYINAKYTSGQFKGNRVEAAANSINRIGIILNTKTFSSTLQINQIGDAFGDASNAVTSSNPIAGYIPSYTVADFSTTYRVKNYVLKAGINNLTNAMYFTRRTDEYPGPGIIPAIGRSIYIGLTAKF